MHNFISCNLLKSVSFKLTKKCFYFSVSYESSAITYVWKNDEDTLRKSPSLTTLNAYLIQNQTIACPIKASWRGKNIYCKTRETCRKHLYIHLAS